MLLMALTVGCIGAFLVAPSEVVGAATGTWEWLVEQLFSNVLS